LQKKEAEENEVAENSLDRVDSSARRIHSSSRSCFLCFGGRFRLSGMTRVTAGAIPEFRAARRASVPLSKILFRFRFISRIIRGKFPAQKN
jgi:hypothetical protein